MRSRAAALLATVVVAAGFGVPARAAKPKFACSVAGQWEPRGQGWTAIKLPQFPDTDAMPLGQESDRRAQFAVHPSDPYVLYSTNGTRVLKSTDGGCKWEQIFVVGESVPTPPANTHFVRDIVLAATPASRDTIYLLIMGYTQELGTVHSPTYRVVKSTDAGKSWTVADTGLPLVGSYTRLHGAPSDPNRLYLTSNVHTLATQTGTLWVSKDGGATWTPLGDVASEARRPRVFDVFKEIHIAVDPLDPDDIWRYDGHDGLYRSPDGGTTWNRITGFDEPSSATDVAWHGVREVELFHQVGQPLQVVVTITGQCAGNNNSECSMFRSMDGGVSWFKQPLPGYSASFEFTGRSDKLVMMSDGVNRYDNRAASRGAIPWVNIGPSGAHSSLLEVFAAGSPTSTLYATEGFYPDFSPARYIYRYTGRL